MGSFVPCSPRHHHCSPSHAEFVRNYRLERHRQWLEFENETALHPGDIRTWKENGGHLITMKDAMEAQTSRKEKLAWLELTNTPAKSADTTQETRMNFSDTATTITPMFRSNTRFIRKRSSA